MIVFRGLRVISSESINSLYYHLMVVKVMIVVTSKGIQHLNSIIVAHSFGFEGSNPVVENRLFTFSCKSKTL